MRETSRADDKKLRANNNLGNQVVFSSINLGTDDSKEGRIIIKSLLEAVWEGIGTDKTTPIFPIVVFKIKGGINRFKEDKNYDLYQQAKRTAAKRFYPTFVNLDATFNQSELWNALDKNRKIHECSIMGCRTRTFENRHGIKTSLGRGNACYATINLPRLGILAKGDLDKFFVSLDEKITLVIDYLTTRHEFQSTGLAKQFWYAIHNLMINGKELKPGDEVREVVKHFTLAVGFIGLAETLIALTGMHHGESEKSQELGLKIIKFMKERTDYWSEKLDKNISVFSVPAEGSSNRMSNDDLKRFGEIKGITDHGYYTNSHQIPLNYVCSMQHKIDIEAPYHELTRAGHILRLEFDGDPTINEDAVSAAIDYAVIKNAGYFGVNHNDNYCEECGHNFKSRSIHNCPKCGSKDIRIISTITGYLVTSVDKWNSGKKAEFKARVGYDANGLKK